MSVRLSLCASALLASFAAVASAAQIQGILIDQLCSSKAEVRIVSGPRLVGGMIVAEAETRECALKPACQRSGYGVFTYDNKFLKFDPAGNRKALAALKASKKEDDLKVEVTGEVQGDMIKVASLKLME
ncbi:MAG: hypothetical protein WBE37_03560 [Bryobacteraceae bacterium]